MRAFVGRDREFSALLDALQGTLHGSGSLVLVSGEAGIGKSYLANELAQHAREQGVLVLTGHCYDLSASPPYGPWMEITDEYPVDPELPELPDVLARGLGMGDLSSQAELFESARDFIVTVSESRPVLLILEDLHWSDQASLELLRYVARKVELHPVMLLATYRNDELFRQHPLFRLLPSLVREARTERIELGELDQSAVTELVRSKYELGDSDVARLVRYLMDWADGNPLFTDEVLRTLERERSIQKTTNGWRLASLSETSVPSLIKQLIESRIESFPAESRNAIRVASVIGQRVPLQIWESVTDRGHVDKAIEDALVAGLFRDDIDVGGVTFRHALVREAIHSTIPLYSRRTLHRELADLFINQERNDPDAIAYHLRQAGDVRATEWLTRAGEAAERSFAWQEAFERYNEALDMLGDLQGDTSMVAGLMLKAARLMRFLDTDKARDYLKEANRIAVQRGDQAVAAAAQFNIGTNLCNRGDFTRGIREMREAIEFLEQSPEEAERIVRWSQTSLSAKADVLQAWLGSMTINLSISGRFRQALTTGERSLRVRWADTSSEAFSEQFATHTHSSLDAYEGIGLAQAALGYPADAKRALSLSHELHQRLSYSAARVIVSSLELIASHFPYRTDDLRERAGLIEIIEQALDHSTGMVGNQNTMWGYQYYLLHEGYWDRLREIIASGSRPELFEYRHVSATARARLFWYEGNFSQAQNQCNELLALDQGRSRGDQVFMIPGEAHRVAAGLALERGDDRLARQLLETHDRLLDWSGSVLGRAEGLVLSAQLEIQHGNEDAAMDLLRTALERASDPRQPMALVEVHRALGELHTSRGNLDDAEDHLRQSLDLAEACRLHYQRILTLLARAELDLKAGNAQECRERISNVVGLAYELGANPVLERARVLESRLPSKRGESPYGLSSRELEVLRLLAQGMSDREIADELFISRHTVMRHVSHILRKLDVDSRTAAAAVAVRRNLL